MIFTPGAHNLNPSPQTGPVRTWSYSSLSKFEACPYAVALSKIEGFKEPSGPAADRGSKIHLVLEDYVRGNIDVLDASAGKKPVRPLMDELREAYLHGQVHLEDEWTVDTDWRPTEPKTPAVWGVAKLDVFWRQSATSAAIYDHKSGTSWNKAVKHGDQGMVYAVHAFARYPELEFVTTQFHYCDENTLTPPTTWVRGEISLFRDRLTRRALNLTTATVFRPIPSKANCKWCRYKDEVRRDDGTPACIWGVVD